MPHPNMVNAGYNIVPKNGGILHQITAGAGNDNTEQNGPSIDRLGHDSATVVLLGRANLTASKTLALSCTLQHSTDGSTWADAPAENQPANQSGGGAIATVSTTGDSNFLAEYDVNLRGLNQYMRVQFTGDLSASGTDIATIACLVMLAGSRRLPST